MKINCLGGGPAGLYFSILTKKAIPTAEVSIYERNAPGDTFGWGVVFSDQTLGNLRDADEETFQAITRDFIYWDAISVFHRGEHVRSGGHGFCGIARRRLLALLHDRAKELGVNMHFNTEVESPEALRDCDLLVAADGVNSRVRSLYAESFRPTVEEGKARYIWLGTEQSFPDFTFSFAENDHGVFQVHAYQFNADMSTFIVECDEQSWLNAGLDKADERQSIAYCEELFADNLGGHSLMANRSQWIRFRTVKNERWVHENVVLLGDAAHTAHFSIGSGTKLAMEDAITFSEGVVRGGTVEAAVAHYEAERRDMVSRLQKSASQSREWFEQTRRHVERSPQALTFSMLSRTRRISHDELEVRDEAYVDKLDRWYQQDQAQEPEAASPVVPPMFTPFDLAGMRLDNRMVVSPMCQYSAKDGVPNDWHMVHLGSRAIGGAGLIFAEMTNVSSDGRITPGCTGLYNDEQEAAWSRIVDFVHGQSRAKIAMQLGHAGRKGATKLMWEGYDEPLDEGAWPLLGPSEIPWSPRNQVPRAMTREDMDRVREDFVQATLRSERCGFDMVEVHLAHGYLLSSFLTPLSNQREDEYGGSLENRARFPLEVVRAVREVWQGKPLSVRISATDWVEGGFDADDAVALTHMLKAHGVDIIDVSAGQTSPDAKPVYGRAFQMPFSERIRNEVGIPTITVGNIWTPDQVNTILLAGRADLVALARAHLAEPYWTLRAASASAVDDPARWPLQYRAGAPMLDRITRPEDR